MMMLALFLAPMLLTLVLGAMLIPVLVARHVAEAESGTVEGDWEPANWGALEQEMEMSEIDEVWEKLAEVADEVEEWFALMDYAAGYGEVVELSKKRTVKKRATYTMRQAA